MREDLIPAGRDGLVEGHLTIPVLEDPVDVGTLLSGSAS
jgi:hypothetical protein